MRAITVRQPWAWAIIHGGKDVENRSRNIAGKYRGPVAIHAARTWAGDDALAEVERQVGFDATPGGFILGNIIGVVDLVDVHQCALNLGCWRSADVLGWVPALGIDRKYETCSEWGMAGHRHLVFDNPRALATPIPYRGQLGLWTLPDDVLAGVL